MKLSPGELQADNLISEVNHSELLSFLRQYMRVLNPWVVAYWLFNAAAVTAFIVYLVINRGNVDNVMSGIGLGFAFFFVPLLPIHEFIHGVTYQFMGAKRVQYKADLKQFMFYALADNFVANRKEFTLVAIMPFLLINTLLICGIIFFDGRWDLIFMGSLIMHISGCFGDFALISFFYEHRNKNVVTYDDAVAKKTFFHSL